MRVPVILDIDAIGILSVPGGYLAYLVGLSGAFALRFLVRLFRCLCPVPLPRVMCWDLPAPLPGLNWWDFPGAFARRYLVRLFRCLCPAFFGETFPVPLPGAFAPRYVLGPSGASARCYLVGLSGASAQRYLVRLFRCLCLALFGETSPPKLSSTDFRNVKEFGSVGGSVGSVFFSLQQPFLTKICDWENRFSFALLFVSTASPGLHRSFGRVGDGICGRTSATLRALLLISLDPSQSVNECEHPATVLVLHLQCTPSTLSFYEG